MTEKGKEAMLHFIYNNKTVCVLVSHDIEQGEYVLQVPYYPPIETIDDFRNDPERCIQIVRDAMSSDPHLLRDKYKHNPIELVQVNSWRMEAVVADSFY